MGERFVSEEIRPLAETYDTAAMAGGGPGLPAEFTWRDERIAVAELVRSWRETGPCRHGSGERYVRRHWFELLSTDGRRMKVYFERQPKGGRRGARWWLYTVSD